MHGKSDLRCYCSRKPLLATYGRDEKGQLYVHVKIFKQQRIFGEIVVTEGKVRLRCRECLRWFTVRIVQPGEAVLQEEKEPPVVGSEA